MVPAVSMRSVSCKIGRQSILEGINLEVERAEVIGILGPNGAGKTTLLSLITGLRRHAEGEITVLGEKLPAGGAHLRRKIGVVLQETALYEELTVTENLRFAASLYGLANERERLSAVLDLLMLSDRAKQVVSTLSGGLKRRVAIARALLHEPELLIIDEPTLGVDVEARHAIWSHLRLLRSQGATIVVSTNYLDEAQALCTRVAVLCQGKLIACEAPDTLVARTGNCVDVECGEQAAESIDAALRPLPSVLRVERRPAGLTVFLRSEETSAEALNVILQDANVEALRKRAPDLAEVFKALGAKI